ncbi:TRAP transporter substrate-binding protein [Polycladidibacter hongkongensis]|uniref:TRAP transporter substrate-binding protein n=1 Tax=Polycladidibacter hongkongensis TaxID=1647556 RepID=UPI00082A9E69|nr:TRAP transporter substrate-binding protein [Pseudovibrio hongkongensis]
MAFKGRMIGLLAGVSLAVSGASALAAEYTLQISGWGPPTHGLNAKMFPKFIEMVEEATDGRVTGELKLGLAPPPAQMDMVMDGAVDVSVIFHGYQPGRFNTTKLIELPGYSGSAEAASTAYWRVYEKYLAKAKEHRGVKLLALHTHGPAQLYSVSKVSGLGDIAGLKLRVPGGVGGDVGKALGATGIAVPAPKVYETLASNAADGVVMPMESRVGFKLTEVAPHTFEIPGGLYRGSFAYIMNEDTFADLPADLQKALEEKVFGEPLSRELGKIWDEIDTIGREATLKTEDNTITAASVADMAAFDKIRGQVIDKVLLELKEQGVDSINAHEMIKQEMAKF